MPAPPLSNTFEGGSDGVAITTGNSGGTSGDAFTGIDGTLSLYSNVSPAHGGMAMRIVDTAASTRVRWNALGSITTDVWMRAYLNLSALPVTNTAVIFKAQVNAGTQCMALLVNKTTGTVQALNAANGVIASSLGSVSVPFGSWFRLEMRVLASATVGEIEWKWWSSPDSSGTPDDTVAVTGQALGVDYGEALFGLTTSAPATPFTIYYDDIAVSSTGWIGPSAQQFRPDADVTTTGWTTTPLWSKVDEATADGTVITATAS